MNARAVKKRPRFCSFALAHASLVLPTPRPTHASPYLRECFIYMRRFQVKINPGAPIQIVQNGVTIRHPALPPHPESPPQPLPPLNFDALTTTFPALPSQFISNPVRQQLTATGPSSIFPSSGSYHNLFKRDKNESRKRDNHDEAVVSDLTDKKSIAKRDTAKTSKATGSDDKVSSIESHEVESKRLLSQKKYLSHVLLKLLFNNYLLHIISCTESGRFQIRSLAEYFFAMDF